MTSPSKPVTNRQIMDEVMSVFGGMTPGEIYTYSKIGTEQVALNLGMDLEAGVARVMETVDLYHKYPSIMFFVEAMERAELAHASAPPAPASVGYVYLLQDPVSKLYKIGRSATPEERLKAINSNFPPGRALIKMIDYAKVENPDEVEGDMHWAYKYHNVEREWFQLSPKDVSDIRKFFRRKEVK